jgi:hypothetical protein
LGGGNNRTAVCDSLKAAWEASHPGEHIEITRMGEDNNKDLFGHVEYKYICDGVTRSSPVYVSAPSRHCGLKGVP